MGALSHIETMPEVDDTDGAGYIERRSEEQRKQQDRRGQTRNGQIIPDRRFDERRNK